MVTGCYRAPPPSFPSAASAPVAAAVRPASAFRHWAVEILGETMGVFTPWVKQGKISTSTDPRGYVHIYMFQVRGPPPSPPPWSWFSLPPCGCGCCRYCMVAPPPLWMWVPPVDVSPVRSVWFAPLPLCMWVLFAPYTK